jgi:hypothetical protein
VFAEPTGIDSGWDRLTVTTAQELYPLYLSWDQLNPENRNMDTNWPMSGGVDEEHPERAGMAAAVERKVGAGIMRHICTNIFDRYGELGDPQILLWLRELFDFGTPPRVQTDAPSWIDLSLRQSATGILIHFINKNPGRDVLRACP